MAITLFGSVAVPPDGTGTGTSALDPTAFANPPIASMVAGDLVFVYAWCRTASATIAVSNAGGQTWNSLTSTNATNTTATANAFWCRYNGTWSAAPSFSFGATTNNTVVMLVFRPSASVNKWGVDSGNLGTFTQKTAAASFTITGWTPTNQSNVNIGVWSTADDNTWGTLTGTNWIKTSLSAQYRNVAGSDTSVSIAYQIQTAAAATNNVTQTELTLGNDAGLTLGISFYEYDPVIAMASFPGTERPYFPKRIISSGREKIIHSNIDVDAAKFLGTSGIVDTKLVIGTNELINRAKLHGWWTLCNAIYPFIGGTASTCKWNLKDPRDLDAAFRLDIHNGTFSSGFGLNATDVYADTHLAPNALSQNSLHYSMFNDTAASFNGGSGVAGNNSTLPYTEMYFDGTSPNQRIFFAINTILDDALTTGVTHKGYHIISRSSSTNVNYFFNGLLKTNATRTSTTPGSQNIFIGAHNTAASPGTPTQFDGGTIQFFTIGSDISAAIAALMYSDIVDFNTFVR